MANHAVFVVFLAAIAAPLIAQTRPGNRVPVVVSQYLRNRRDGTDPDFAGDRGGQVVARRRRRRGVMLCGGVRGAVPLAEGPR